MLTTEEIEKEIDRRLNLFPTVRYDNLDWFTDKDRKEIIEGIEAREIAINDAVDKIITERLYS